MTQTPTYIVNMGGDSVMISIVKINAFSIGIIRWAVSKVFG